MGNPIKKILDPIKEATDWVGDQIEDGVDFVVEDAPDYVSDAFASFEDGIRTTIEGVDDLIQNPYVRMAVRFIPGYGQIAGAMLDTYAKLDSGETLSAGDIANLAAAYGSNNPTDWKLTDNQIKAINASASIADGASPYEVLVSTYGDDILKETGFVDDFKNSVADAYGQDVVDFFNDNEQAFDLGWQIGVEGKDISDAVAGVYGSDIVNYLGADSVNEKALGYAGLATAVGLDQGLNSEDAFLKGLETYNDKGGTVPDIGTLGQIAGVDWGDIDVNTDFLDKLTAYVPDVSGLGGIPINWGEIEGLGNWFQGQGYGIGDINNFLAGVDTNLSVGDIDLSGFDFTNEINLGGLAGFEGIDFTGLENPLLADFSVDASLTGVDAPDFELPSIDIPEVNLPDINLPQIASTGGSLTGKLTRLPTEQLPVQPVDEEEIPLSNLLLTGATKRLV